MIKKGVLGGMVSGVLLGLFFKLIEQITSIKVYTLLLNVDYVPFLKEIPRSELFEFCLHLIVSVILSILLMLYLNRKNTPQRKRVHQTILFCLLIGVLLYPTTALSSRTPELWNGSAFGLWLMGHVLYGWILGYLLREKSE